MNTACEAAAFAVSLRQVDGLWFGLTFMVAMMMALIARSAR
jgi:hypothetical protein